PFSPITWSSLPGAWLRRWSGRCPASSKRLGFPMRNVFGCLRCRCKTSPPQVDVVLNLREARRRCGLTQDQAARLSGVHSKSISSFETGERIGSIKLAQLVKLLRVYGMTPAEFFMWTPDEDFMRFDDQPVVDERESPDLAAVGE